MDPTSKKEGHCDITAHTVLLYVLFCLTYMYCTLVCTIHTVHCTHSTCSLFPCFPVSDVEVSSSTSVHTLVHTYISSLVHSLLTCVHTTLILTKLLSSTQLSVRAPHHLGVTTISILVYTILILI